MSRARRWRSRAKSLADPTGERYATVAVGLYDEQGSRLTYALAGHPPPIMRGFQVHEPLTICSSPPLGCGVRTGCRQSTVLLPAGAEVCFFSDGLIEARSSFPRRRPVSRAQVEELEADQSVLATGQHRVAAGG